MKPFAFPHITQQEQASSADGTGAAIRKHGWQTQIHISRRKTIGIVFARQQAFTTSHYGEKRNIIGIQEIIVSPSGCIRTVRTYKTQPWSLYAPTRWVRRREWTSSREGLDKRVIAWQKAGDTLLYDCTGVYGDLPPWLDVPVEQRYLIHRGQVRRDKPVTRDTLAAWLDTLPTGPDQLATIEANAAPRANRRCHSNRTKC